MEKLEYCLTEQQRHALSGLAYWIADEKYFKERNSPEELPTYRGELEKIRKTISCCFSECDALKIPFWVQNTVIGYASDWRRYKSTGMDQYLEKRNIFRFSAITCG